VFVIIFGTLTHTSVIGAVLGDMHPRTIDVQSSPIELEIEPFI
jgi:hypothetical protein